MAHITGGGITENLPRILPEGTAARIRTSAWTAPRLFLWLQESGRVPVSDMMRTFNMGIGLIVATTADKADRGQECARRLYHRRDRYRGAERGRTCNGAGGDF